LNVTFAIRVNARPLKTFALPLAALIAKSKIKIYPASFV